MKPKNVLIYTTPRTGSSTLNGIIRESLIKTYGLKDPLPRKISLYEVFDNTFPSDVENIINYIDHITNSNVPLTIKVMHNQLDEFTKKNLQLFTDLLIEKKFHVISLSRKNIKDQILSFYIALQSGEFDVQSNKKIIADYESFSKHFLYTMKTYSSSFYK